MEPDTNLKFFLNDLKGFVNKRIRDRSLAEDILHDVFLKVQLKQSQLRRPERIYNWIYQVAQNTILDHFRKESRIIQLSDLDWGTDPINFNACVADYLIDLLPTLPDKYKEALQLTELGTLSQMELANQLGISYSGAKSRVQRAKQMLKDKVDEILIIKTDCYGNAIVCRDRVPCC